jgi:THO complex subunit 2
MPPKRKRGGADQGGSRPAPHRPDQTALGQHDRGYNDGGTRGGRGGRNSRRSTDRRDSGQHSYGQSAAAPSASNPSQTATVSRPSNASAYVAPAPAAPTPVAARPPSPKPSVYIYAVITNDRVAKWIETGRKEVADHGIQSRVDEDATELAVIYQELLRSILDSRLDPSDAGGVIKEVIGDVDNGDVSEVSTFDPRTNFLDTISIYVDMDEKTDFETLRKFMVATNIPILQIRQVLDHELLMRLGFLRDTFHRMSIRQSTNLLYRQQSYNLLREETEGFSKLVTELYQSANEAGPDFTFETAQATFERIKSLIGTFDLDVGRVLDISLDCFASTLIKQFRFIVKFLRISSWWPRHRSAYSDRSFLEGLPRWAQPELAHEMLSDEQEEAIVREERRKRDTAFWDAARQLHLDAFFQLGEREVADEDAQRLAEDITDTSAEERAKRMWIKVTKTAPPPGNRVAAQILGFKLRFYSSQARSATDVLPANLLFLAALLIKIGFISLVDLYPHLWPLDGDMEELRQKRKQELAEKEKKSRSGGAANALMMAGALPDDMPPLPSASSRRDATSNKSEASKAADTAAATDASDLPEPLDQKVQLLEHLLTIGAIPESLFILGRHPWIPEAYPESIIPLIHRILLQSISEVANSGQPTIVTPTETPGKMITEADQSGMPKGSVRQSEQPPKRPLRWPFPDKSDVGEGQAYRYYFDEWADNIPVCRTVDDIFTLCGTFLNVSGVNIGKDPELLIGLARIGATSLGNDPSQPNRDRWRDLLKRLLVPALSVAPCNSSCISAVWALLERYPVSVRYNIYAEWYEGSTSRLEPITKAFSRTRLDTLSTMKRLSLKNISEMARTLAKTAYTSPGVVFKVALDQIEAYSNLIQAFVECAKYFTNLGYDVLVWSLMSSLGGKQRSRTQETSILLTSKWLQALSKFSGSVFKRYSIMDVSPVLQYVNNQLFHGNSTDLVILKELIHSMGGLVSDVDFTDAQIQAMSGGEALRRQTLIGLQDKRFESGRSSKRLMQALVDSRLAGRLLCNIAQYRQSAIYKVPEDEAHIKYLGTVVDDTHQTLTEYLDLLRSNLDSVQFDELVPSTNRLMEEVGLNPSLAFMIGRAGLAHQMSRTKVSTGPSSGDTQTSEEPQASADADGDVAMADGKSITTQSKLPIANGFPHNDKMPLEDKATYEGTLEVNGTTILTGSRKSDQMLDILAPLINTVKRIMPEETWQRITPEFFVIFWALQLGDMTVPQTQYMSEHDRLKKQAEDVMRDRTDMTRSGMNKKNEKKDALLDTAKTIRDEMLSHAERNQKTKLRLLKHANTWFVTAIADVRITCDILLEQCIYPRMALSASDAEYAFKMTKFLHDNRVPNFTLKAFYDRLFNPNRIRDFIFACTVREAEHLGRFLKHIVLDLSKWHADKALYEREGLGSTGKESRRTYLGFAKAFGDDGKAESFYEHPQFRDILYGWHKNLYIALKDCLDDSEWMHIRNAITVLKTIMECFPAVDFMGKQYSAQLKKITDREAASKIATESEAAHRVDLSVAAQTAYSGLLKRSKKWVMVQAFRPNLDGVSIPNSPCELLLTITQTGKPQEEQKATEAPNTLRPTALEFKPLRTTS